MEIYYFTRTNESEEIAKLIAQTNSGQVHKIDDGQNWNGIINFIKAGAMASKGQLVNIEYTKPCSNEDIILVFPVWAGTFPPAIRTFLKDFDTKKITAVVLSAVSSLSDKEKNIFKVVYEAKGKIKKPPSELL